MTGGEDPSEPEQFSYGKPANRKPLAEVEAFGWDIVHLHSMCHDNDLLRTVERIHSPARDQASAPPIVFNTVHLNYENQAFAMMDKVLTMGFLKISAAMKIGELPQKLQEELDRIGDWIRTNIIEESQRNLLDFQAQIRLLSYTDNIIHLTEHGKQKAIQYMGKFFADHNSYVIGNGAHEPLAIFEVKQISDTPTLLYSGRLATEKGMIELCEAYRALSAKRAVKLIVHGDPPRPPDLPQVEYDELLNAPRERYDADFFKAPKEKFPGSVWHEHTFPLLRDYPPESVEFYRFLGGDECDDGKGPGQRGETYMLDFLMHRADVVIIPSYSETFCITALDALIRYRPVILSKIYALEELYGDVCLYAEPKNHFDLERAISHFLEMDQQSIRTRATTGYQLATRYTWPRIADRTFRRYWAELPDIPEPRQDPPAISAAPPE